MNEVMSAILTPPLRELSHGSPGYHELVRLRDLYLRQPIGLRLHPEDLLGEEGHRHFALAGEEGLVGGLIAVPLGDACAKLRQMWVHPDLRGHGHGQRLLQEVESLLAAAGIRHFILHSRQDATGFYARSGYQPTGPLFTEVGRPHQRMEKHLP